MSEQYLGQISFFSFNFAPKGWAFCNGQILPINQNQALFSLLGTTFGGNGTTTFQLPNLQGRVPLHAGSGFTLGETGGETAHTLTLTELPAHTHAVQGTTATATALSPASNVFATSTDDPYGPFPATAPVVTLNAGSLGPTGGGQPHDNHQPYLVINACIALSGIFPSQN